MDKNTEEKELLKKIYGDHSPFQHKIPEDSEELDVKLVGSSFSIEWCESCGGVFVRCPKCGNNTCNGGSGQDEDGNKCKICLIAYDLRDAINKANKEANKE